jgi:hypothetical protein
MEKMLSTFTHMTKKAKIMHFWHRLAVVQRRENRAINAIIRHIYRSSLLRVFLTWKVKAAHLPRIGVIELQRHGMRNWKRALAAGRLHRYHVVRRVLLSWKKYCRRIDRTKMLHLRRRRRMWRIAIR